MLSLHTIGVEVRVGIGSSYLDTQRRFVDITRDAGPQESGRRVPACPGWTVHDLAAHVTGVVSDVLAGRIDGVATDVWTQAQVEARRDLDLAALLDEWQSLAPDFTALLDQLPGWYGVQALFDLGTHEHDLRGAFGRPGARDSQPVLDGLDLLLCAVVHPAAEVLRLGPLRVRAGDRSWLVGDAGTDAAIEDVGAAIEQAFLTGARPPDDDGRPATCLSAEPFELFRALSGRRSERQIRALDWSSDPSPYLTLFGRGPFTVRPDDLVE